jgi:hypothetical protein
MVLPDTFGLVDRDPRGQTAQYGPDTASGSRGLNDCVMQSSAPIKLTFKDGHGEQSNFSAP